MRSCSRWITVFGADCLPTFGAMKGVEQTVPNEKACPWSEVRSNNQALSRPPLQPQMNSQSRSGLMQGLAFFLSGNKRFFFVSYDRAGRSPYFIVRRILSISWLVYRKAIMWRTWTHPPFFDFLRLQNQVKGARIFHMTQALPELHLFLTGNVFKLGKIGPLFIKESRYLTSDGEYGLPVWSFQEGLPGVFGN